MKTKHRELLLRTHGYVFYEVVTTNNRLVIQEGESDWVFSPPYEVSFDINNNPHLYVQRGSHVDSTVRFMQKEGFNDGIRTFNVDDVVESHEIPKDILIELERAIKLKYPNGFHSRTDNKRRTWIYHRIKSLESKGKFRIDGEVEPYGGILIDGTYFDAYRTWLKYGDELTEIIIASYPAAHDRFVVFRKFLRRDIDSKLPAFTAQRAGIVKLAENRKRTIEFYNDVVGVTVISFDQSDQIASLLSGVRDDIHGTVYVSMHGKFDVHWIKTRNE